MDEQLEIDFFLDSGAFSAWSMGAKIDIDKYIEFIYKYKDKVSLYANLDVIYDGKASFENWKYIRSCGLEPLPVFHTGTPAEYLEHYLDNVDYIAVGGIADASTEQIIQSLDRVWTKFLVDDKGMPRVRVHGFGITSLRTSLRYPWYSVDSATWLRASMYGSILMPRYVKSKWIYNEAPHVIWVSDVSPRRREEGNHLLSYPKEELEHIMEYIHIRGSEIGKSEYKIVSEDYKLQEGEYWALSDVVLSFGCEEVRTEGKGKIVEIRLIPGLCNDHVKRAEMNVDFFQAMADSAGEYPRPFEKKRPTFGLVKI